MPPLFRRSIHMTVAVLAFTIALVSFIVKGVVWQRMERSVHQSIHAAEIQAMLEREFSILQDAETGQRGYLLTGDPAFLVPYEKAVADLPVHRAALDQAMAEHAGETRTFNEWKQAASTKLDELQNTIKIYREQSPAAALEKVKDGSGRNLMDQVRAVRSRIVEMTSADLGRANLERRKRMKAALTWTTAAGISGVIAGLVALMMFGQAHKMALAEEVQSRRAEIAEEVGKQKSSFLANMSHEIRTPMNAVLGFTELMELEPMSEKLRSHLHSVRQAGQSLLQLINDILDISKVEAGMVAIHPHPTDLREVCEFVRTVVGQVCAKKGVDLRVDVPRSVPRSLLLDEGRVRQILVNLAGNASRFTERGYVRVAAAAQHAEEDRARLTLTLTVEDTGVGIPAEKHRVIFDPFVQADSRRNVEREGTGLGLSIVKRLTELMGGTIHLQSEPGRGSTFTVVITRVEVAAQLPAYGQSNGDAGVNLDDFPSCEILVVDDNPVNRDLLAGIFEGSHHRMRFAANGLDAIEAAKEHKPTLVLMDVRMPVMTGTEAVERMRREPSLEMVPVIAVTASSLLGEEGAVRKAFSGYLRKPFSRAELYCQIAQFIPPVSKTGVVRLPEIAVEAPASETQAAGWETAVITLRRMESSSWMSLRSSLAITEAREFAARLLVLAETSDCPPLRSYAEDLRSHANNFAADELERHLAAFPQLIALLEERISQTASHGAA